MIVPHAGYVYSGPIAAAAYAELRSCVARFRRVVVIGPAHRVPVRGLAVSSADAFATPLGAVTVDADARDDGSADPGSRCRRRRARARAQCGGAAARSCSESRPGCRCCRWWSGTRPRRSCVALLDAVWDDGTLLMVSTDLSHYLEYERPARGRYQHGRATSWPPMPMRSATVTRAAPTRCGRCSKWGRARNLRVDQLDLRSSGDTAGPRDQVVGYGAFAVEAIGDGTDGPRRARLTAERTALLDVAARRHRQGAGHRPGELLRRRSVETRCCLRPAPRSSRCCATTSCSVVSAASTGGVAGGRRAPLPRCRPRSPIRGCPAVTLDDFEAMTIKVSVLSPLEPVDVASYAELARVIRPGVDGLVIEARAHRATLAPFGVGAVRGREPFLDALWAKAGLAPGLAAGLRVERYTTEEFASYGPSAARRPVENAKSRARSRHEVAVTGAFGRSCQAITDDVLRFRRIRSLVLVAAHPLGIDVEFHCFDGAGAACRRSASDRDGEVVATCEHDRSVADADARPPHVAPRRRCRTTAASGLWADPAPRCRDR